MRHLAAWFALLASVLVVAGCGGGGSGGGGLPEGLYLTADAQGLTGLGGGPDGAPAPAAGAAEDAALAEGAAEDLAREIEEADLYRVDGDTLYLLNAWRGFAAVDLAGVRVLGRLPTGGVPREMFLVGDRALVLLDRFDGGARLLDVSVADPTAPAATASLDLPGAYRTSRLVGDLLHVVTEVAVQTFRVGTDVVPAGSATLPYGAAFATASETLLAVSAFGDGGTTPVTLVDVSSPAGVPAVRGTVHLAGWVGDDHKLHLAGGTLRVVTHDFTDGGLSHLFVVGLADLDAPTVIGSLSLARGEQTFATRFTDDAAYIVTFLQVDPLWVIDLRTPTAPRIAGSLVTPGWSTHLVPVPGGRLVGLGVDPADGWHVIASLFDVSNPAAPALLDRVDFGWGWSSAFGDVKALGVFADEGLVFVPVAGEGDRVAVLDLGASALALRGEIDLVGTALRGFPHARGLVAISAEEVAVVDPSTLADLGRAVVAENVVDAARLPDGRRLDLKARGDRAEVGGVTLPFWPERMFPVGMKVAVTGWDGTGRAAYVVDFGPATPVVSPRLALGGAWYAIPGPPILAEAGVASTGVATPSGDALLTAGGRLVVHGVEGFATPPPGEDRPVPLGVAEPSGAADGFLVVNVAAMALEAPVEVATGFVTGFCADGETLLYTVGSGVGTDDAGRPWMRHDLVRLDLATREASAPLNVPGWILSAADDLVFTAEEVWGQDWSCALAVVASRIPPAGEAEVLSRLALPEGAYGLAAAGATLWFLEGAWGVPMPLPGTGAGGVDRGSGAAMPAWADGGMPWLPETSIGTVRLGATLARGPSVEGGTGFLSLLLPEPDAALVVRDGVTVERWDASADPATLDWEAPVGACPLGARPDPATGGYLLALGYGGVVEVP